jgi:hydroxymethylpyrimidine pyrophosphatase-like HAD family hydrolase
MGSHKKFFFIDWDGTLVSSNSVFYIEHIRRYFLKHGSITQKIVYPFVFIFLPFILFFHFLRKEKTRDALSYFLYLGLTKEEIYLASLDLWQKKGHYFNKNIYLDIKKELASGEFSNVYIVSGSIDTIIEAAFDVFQIEFLKQNIHSTRLNYNKNKTSGTVENGTFILGGQKVRIIRNILNSEDLKKISIIVYTDSSSDLPMLSICNYAKLINPDNLLKLKSQNHPWEIIDASQVC